MAKILLTVPHAACRSEDDKIKHTCDIVAERCARKLFDLLTDKGHRVALRIAGVNRMEVDYNRPESRGTEWRKNLEKDYAKADLLIDCHSYPQQFHWPLDLVILKWLDEHGGDNREFAYGLLSLAIQKDINGAVAYSQKQNDIVCSSLEAGLPAVLVEFSEVAVAAKADKVVERFAEAVDEFAKQFEKKKATSEAKVPELLDQLFE